MNQMYLHRIYYFKTQQAGFVDEEDDAPLWRDCNFQQDCWVVSEIISEKWLMLTIPELFWFTSTSTQKSGLCSKKDLIFVLHNIMLVLVRLRQSIEWMSKVSPID